MANSNQDEIVLKELQKLPNIGPACGRDLILIGVRKVEDLKGRNADEMYEMLCERTGKRHDPCVHDTFASEVHFAKTGEAKRWWAFTPERKKR